MKYIFILNPAAGKNKSALAMIPNIQKSCEKNHLDYRIHISQSGEDITEFVKHLCKSNNNYRFYGFGGDGTINKIINGCIDCQNAEVGVFPMGTGNDFIRTTNIETKNFFNLEKQLFSKSKKVDTIKYNGKYCINLCNIGFDANVAIEMPRFKKIPLISNKAAYNMSIIYNFVKKINHKMEILADDKPFYKGDILMCAIGNGISCGGGGFMVTPLAKTNDGLIDLSVTKSTNRINLGLFVRNFSAGTQYQDPKMKKYILFKKCKKVTVISNKKFALVNDGEGEYLNKVTMEIVPHSINFIMPY